jgi:TolB-like protein/Tfp pilus assembly protein PilF
MTTSQTVRFGLFEFDPRSGDLRKQGRKVRLEGQPVQILIKLLERPGELITRGELRRELWQADTFVNFEQSLNAAVKRLRQALGDSPGNPRFVETLARRGYRFIAPVSTPSSGVAPRPAPAPAIGSLAVLPFGNAETDPGTEYLADGITEALINHLSRLPALRVMARSTVFRYKDKPVDPRSVGRKLGVDALLLGRVRQRGDALHVRTELVEVQNGWQLWGEQYNRRLADIFSVEEEISHEISDKLRFRLTGEDRGRLAKRYTESTEAYQDYLRGRYHLNRLIEGGLKKSIECFQNAIQKDPNYALAYTGLADALGLVGVMGLVPAAEVMPKAKEAARRAVEIDDTLPEAHGSLASIFKNYDWDFVAAERELKRALDLNPNYANGHRLYASFLAALSRPEESLREIRLALDLDPFSLPIRVEAAYNSYMAADYQHALQEALRTLDLEPQFAPAQSILSQIYEQQGRYEEAITAMEKARVLANEHPATLAGLAHVHASAGRTQEARALIGQLIERSQQQHVSQYWLALAHAGAGEKTAALDALEKAYEQHDVILVWLGTEPRLDSLRSEPRFIDLLRRIGLIPFVDTARSGG